ncbi:hypothetical protein [Microbacterium excoecariae]|uniref:hypothetical protein n=1 Tax=Microbacterium excoecariae TaxID=2715210 RepID=UPI001408DA7E|nr:hypothetical protein [Microbacterium excoecariae]NHI16418.1 hypothetical protein [Microbacterium excoecariae]
MATGWTRQAVVWTAALAAGSAALAGCSSSVPAVPDAPASNMASPPVTGAAPSPTPTEEAGPANDPSDADSWVVTTAKVGPIEVGGSFADTLEEIRQTGIGTLNDCDGVAYGYAADNAYDVLIVAGTTDEVVEVSIGWNGDTMGVGPRTEEGLGLGSTKAEVLGTYEDAAEAQATVGDTELVEVDGGETDLVFSFVSGYDGAVGLSVVTAGREPAYEPCA